VKKKKKKGKRSGEVGDRITARIGADVQRIGPMQQE